MGGQVGIRDHADIGDGVVLVGRAGITGDVPAGATYSGFPARPHGARLRSDAAALHLPEYVRRIAALEKQKCALEERLAALERAMVASNSSATAEPISP